MRVIQRHGFVRRAAIAAACFVFVFSVAAASSLERAEADLERKFTRNIQPFVDRYCINCHDKDEPKAEFDLSPYTTMSAVVRDHAHWAIVLDRLEAGEMPPEKARRTPTNDERKVVIEWIQDIRKHEAKKNAGDPGPALGRRLSNAEYDNTIRDLIGVDIKPAKEFPVDPANQAGFDNSSESLTMSPALLKKYLQAARMVSEHLVLNLDGFDFAPHPVIADTDRDKYSVLKIVDFYLNQPTDYADYFMAAWEYKHRKALGKSKASLDTIARDAGVSPKYLALIWSTLAEPKESVGPIARLQTNWSQLPAPKKGVASPLVRTGCEEMRNYVVRLREKIRPEVHNMTARGINNSAQAFVLWKNRQWAANRRTYDPGFLQINGQVPQVDTNSIPQDANGRNRNRKPKERAVDEDLFVPSAQRADFEAAFARFSAVFPDAFYVKERARVFLDPEDEKKNAGRLLSAGLHSMTGFFRDDGPLYDLILSDEQQQYLDRLWNEFEMVASVPQRMHTSMIWFERTDSRFILDAEFDFARAEDKNSTSEEMVKRLGALYYAKAERTGASPVALAAIKDHFERVNANIRRVEAARAAAEPLHVKALLAFAEKAYRRPLQSSERESLQAFYRTLREQDKLEHEDAIRDAVVSVLMSPEFLYRRDLIAEGSTIQPLDDYALANRLSYFLWSSMPDDELMSRAAAGELRKPDVLLAQTRRMLKDPKTRALATEFGGNWLEFRRFEEHNSVDRERFPAFDNALRQAMFEEPVRFLLDVVQQNKSALDLVYGKHTFVNPALAKFYGMPALNGASNDWVRVEDAWRYGRGGLLPMSVFLTKNAPGLRTSPVKRGYWVVRRVLGEHIPPPPPQVPELPADESKLGELTLRDTLARHREEKSCAACHERFDAFGLVFEGFGPVGERRELDLGGRPVDITATFPDGSEGSGIEGLQRYIRKQREDDFVDNLSRKLLAFGLGRTLMLSDESTVQLMKSKLASNNYRFGALIESIVTSPQFLNKRGQQNLAQH